MFPIKADRQLLANLSNLCALNIPEERADKLIEDMNEMIEFANRLGELNTGDAGATEQILPLENVLREDVVVPSFDRDAILANAPERDLDGLKVPPVIA